MNTQIFGMNTQTAILIATALALITAFYVVYQLQRRKQQAYWAKQFRNFMIARGIISWGEAQFIPNNPPKEYVTRMTGYKPTSRYWCDLDKAWRKRVEMIEED